MRTLPTNRGPWSPPGLGFPRAFVLALMLGLLIAVPLLWSWCPTSAPPSVVPQQVTAVDFVALSPPRIVPMPAPSSKARMVIHEKIHPRSGMHDRKRGPIVHHGTRGLSKPRSESHPHPVPQVIKSKMPSRRVARIAGPSQSAIAAYSQALHVLIQSHVVVGAMVRQFGLSGSVRLSFVLGPQGGAARDVRILSGGTGPLRSDALKTVRRLSYPPFPKSFGTKDRSFEVVVRINSRN